MITNQLEQELLLVIEQILDKNGVNINTPPWLAQDLLKAIVSKLYSKDLDVYLQAHSSADAELVDDIAEALKQARIETAERILNNSSGGGSWRRVCNQIIAENKGA